MANSVDITNGITKIVEITTQGPKGLKGNPGESPGFSTDIQVRNITSSGFISSNELTLGRIPYISSSLLLGGVIGDHADLQFINQTLVVPGVSALRLVATNNITSSIISASNTTHTKLLRLPQAGGGGSGDGAIYFGSDPAGNNGFMYDDGTSLQLGYNDGDIISLRPSVISLVGNITASGNISGSSSSTASFGRVQASNIGGNSPLRLHDVTEINFGSSPALRGNPIFHGDVNIYSQSAFLDTNDNKFFESNDNGQGASATITFGDASNTRIHGSTIKLGSSTTQHVTASGNISASGDITAASASFNGKIKITGSLDILGNSPAITMMGDIHQARGGYLIKDTGSGILTLQHDANFGIADYAESVSGYNIYNQHTYQFAPRSVISGSFGMTQGFHNSATFYSFAQGRNTSCKPPLNNVGHWPYGNTSQGDSLTIDNGVANSGFNYGFAAHSEGRDTQANVPYSHAEGYGSITTGSQNGGNHAEGYQTIAEGNYAHSEGFISTALGLGSHAEGLGTIASGSVQHTQGKYNTHGNLTSLMVIGNGTSTSSRSDLALFNTDGINFKTNLTASGNISGSGELYFSSSLSASQTSYNVLVQDPLTGKVYHTGSYGTGGSGEDNDWFIGDTFLTSSKMVRITASLTNGSGVSATGTFSHAEGFSTIASGQYSHAEGRQTEAKGISSHAEGFGAISSGSYSHAEGYNTIALGDYSHAEGNETTAAGIHSHAQGFQTRAGGQFALSQGYRTTASGDYSFAFGGAGNISEGDYSITTGTNNKAKGAHSQANGLNTQTSGSYSYAAGESTKTILSASHARAYGKDTEAKGIGSTAGGSGSVAGVYFAVDGATPETHSGHYSIAYGNHVETTKDYQAAFGQYNNTGSESSFNIGIGTSEADKRNIVDFGPTGSIKFDIGSLPNGDPGVEGQLYRTGSGLFGVNGDLQLLLISKG